MKIIPVGGYIPCNKKGEFVNTCSLEGLDDNWTMAVEQTLETYQKVLGDNLESFYLRGSVAKGKVVDNVSDIDCMALVYDVEGATSKKEILKEQLKSLTMDFPKVTDIECFITTEKSISKSSRFLLATQALCLYGQNHFSDERYTLRAASVHENNIQRELLEVQQRFLDNKERQDTKIMLVRWLSKRLLRSLCEIVREQTGKYTRDVYYCREAFLEVYPEYKELTMKFLNAVVNPEEMLPEFEAMMREGNVMLGEAISN